MPFCSTSKLFTTLGVVHHNLLGIVCQGKYFWTGIPESQSETLHYLILCEDLFTPKKRMRKGYQLQILYMNSTYYLCDFRLNLALYIFSLVLVFLWMSIGFISAWLKFYVIKVRKCHQLIQRYSRTSQIELVGTRSELYQPLTDTREYIWGSDLVSLFFR